jgi:AcrR family transcriptional regulator
VVGKRAEKATRAEQKATTRARVLEVARELLEREGYDATSIRAVAKGAGVAAGTVLLHFPDKTQLLHAALFDDLERTWALAKATAKRRSLERDGEELARTFLDYYARRPLLSRTLLRESLFAAPPWSARFAAQVAEVHAHVAQLAALAIERRDLPPDADPALIGAVFFSFYYFTLLAWLQGGHPEPMRLFSRMWSQHLKALAPASDPERKR